MEIRPDQVHETLGRVMLVEGYPMVLDLEKSRGQYLHDARSNRTFLDFFAFYASRALAFDHPALSSDDFIRSLHKVGRCKPSNGDVYTTEFAEFVSTFESVAMGSAMKHAFFIDGGALAVENALKAAFDWKVQKNLARGGPEKGGAALHFKSAFHGRSGYTLSLTNTFDPRKTRYFPQFDWPRVDSPALRFPADADASRVSEQEEMTLAQIDAAYERYGQDAIACIIIEPIQCEAGDRHFRNEFFLRLREICDQREALLIFDEVQTGFAATGTMWYYEQTGVVPDLVCFAKKAQTGGFMSTLRVDEVDSVFKVKSRISSTFGGNLVDYLRSQRILEVIRDDRLVENAKVQGEALLSGLHEMAKRFSAIDNVRGAGLLIAFDVPDTETRDRLSAAAQEQGLLVNVCGARSVRLRPALDVAAEDVAMGLEMMESAMSRTFK